MSDLTPPLGTAGFSVLKENVENLDIALNTDGESWLDRGKRVNVSWKGILNKNAEALKETQDSITILGLPFTTLAEAQAAADDGKIPVGAVTWVRNAGDASLADEYINNGGTLEATGQKMPSQEAVGDAETKPQFLSRELRSSETFHSSVMRTSNWTNATTSLWAVGTLSDGRVFNFIEMWADGINNIESLKISIYSRSTDGATVFPGASGDKLLSSKIINISDVAIKS
ncbi:hypothetical protein ACVMY6_004107, partial [Klebsiella pneumoniae]